MFAVFGDGLKSRTFDTLYEAISYAHEQGCESFEVYNDNDDQVFAFRPAPEWV